MTNTDFSFLTLPETLCTASCYQQSEKILPFIHTDLLIQHAHRYGQPILHFWTLEKTLVLGMKDLRIPHLRQAVSFLKEQKINTVVRNAGGLAVLLDQEVLNVSLIFPFGNNQHLSIEAAYEQYYQWFKHTFSTFGLSLIAGEVFNSYCPGTFDLSLSGKKIAGTAQRRLKDATAVMAYLSIAGNQQKRGKLIQTFYQNGLGSLFGSDGYPPVDPKSMATLNEMSSQSFDLASIQKNLKDSFVRCFKSQLTQVSIESLLDQMDISIQLPQLIKRMEKRNEPLQIIP